MEYLNESFEKNLSLLQSTSCTSINDLPDLLVIDILSRLPVRTLVQSTSVKKTWYSIIKSPSFISTHIACNISDPSNYYMLLFKRHSLSVTVVSEINNVLTRKSDIISPVETKSKSQRVIGACRGLVCLTDYDMSYRGHDIYLINPFIHKCKKIGVESSCHADFIMENVDCNIKVAFGYSEVENDYKVVRILDLEHYLDIERWIIKAEVYSLKSGKWRNIDNVGSIGIPPRNPPVFINGSLYWVMFSPFAHSLHLDPCGYLLCFNLKDEVFSRVALPISTYQILDTCHNTYAKNSYAALYTHYPVFATNNDTDFPTSVMISLDVLEMDTGGQVQWKKFLHESSYLSPADFCMGVSCSGRLIFVEKNRSYWKLDIDAPFASEKLALDMEDEERNWGNWYLVVGDLDNPYAFDKLALDFSDEFSGAINVIESLVLFSD